ncbi:hypothetical protein MHYP_G00225420 [Metynnis hypsauchen]
MYVTSSLRLGDTNPTQAAEHSKPAHTAICTGRQPGDSALRRAPNALRYGSIKIACTIPAIPTIHFERKRERARSASPVMFTVQPGRTESELRYIGQRSPAWFHSEG